ncbi:hypothetical protein DB35_25070 [Streptomyces abyssalis]|uniref:Putative zinc-finger domain-containing protein n=1 Tax=Streptomyces abyssalis TaxID=933944 RepID=A0A1E7JNC4_9ACTN|nr:zf-HC2 domain-containing protein [Streptomyces abyssalis]OEU86872.1 hypothetical protein DB35_25070 [Streptomyces abyssalis]OEU89744.1 hypothetical protein AN215_08495 [Streptomyces abyssalis]OEV31356.1 hypothetical protein AN219_05860 [Streptomyces nanshensis]
MHCSRARTALSARLDQEALPPGVTERRLGEHLAECPDCRRWQDRAEQLERMPAGEPGAGAEPVGRPLDRLRRPEGLSGPDERCPSGPEEHGTGGPGRHAC